MINLPETQIKDKLNEILSHYTGKKDELIPILQEAQEQFRYLPPEVMLEIAKFLRLPESTVFGVSTFYAQFKFAPTGRQKVTLPILIYSQIDQIIIKPGTFESQSHKFGYGWLKRTFFEIHASLSGCPGTFFTVTDLAARNTVVKFGLAAF